MGCSGSKNAAKKPAERKQTGRPATMTQAGPSANRQAKGAGAPPSNPTGFTETQQPNAAPKMAEAIAVRNRNQEPQEKTQVVLNNRAPIPGAPEKLKDKEKDKKDKKDEKGKQDKKEKDKKEKDKQKDKKDKSNSDESSSISESDGASSESSISDQSESSESSNSDSSNSSDSSKDVENARQYV